MSDKARLDEFFKARAWARSQKFENFNLVLEKPMLGETMAISKFF